MRAVPKDAKRYEALAAWARDRGYPKLTASTVESWVRRGLLENAQVLYPDFSVREIREPPDARPALERACHYRFDWSVSSIPIIGVAVWLDGFKVSEALIRSGLRREATAPSRLLTLIRKRPDVKRREAAGAAAVATVDEKRFFVAYNPAGLSEADARSWRLIDGLAAWLMLVLDAKANVSDEDLATFGRILGIDAPARDAAKLLRDVAGSLRTAKLARRVATMQFRNIEAAKVQAMILLESAGDPATQHPEFKAIVLLAAFAMRRKAHSA